MAIEEARLSQLELLLGSGLLEANYDALTPTSGEQCKQLVLEYLRLSTTISHLDVDFIKNLTKVTRHILESEPASLDGLLEKLFSYNMEGVEKVRGGIEGRTSANLTSLESHLLGDAGNAARALFDTSNDISWAERWYDANKKSADMTVEIEPRHSAHAYSFAGNAAKALNKATKNPSWAQTAIECYYKFLEYYKKNPDPRMNETIRFVLKDINFLGPFAARLNYSPINQ